MIVKSPLLFTLLLGFVCIQCKDTNTILERVLSNTDPAIQTIVQQLEKHEVQILLTEVIKLDEVPLDFKSTSFQLNNDHYFYPASTVKLPIAALALQKLRELNSSGIPIDAETQFEIRDREGAPIQLDDASHSEGKLTIAHLIKKIFLVSDNDAYNYLFDFLGRDYINASLQKMGLQHTQIFHKFLADADNEKTWEYTFFSNSGETLYHQQSLSSQWKASNSNLKGVRKGKGFNSKGTLVESPMNFSEKNRIAILDLEGILRRLIFPESFPPSNRFGLETADYDFLRFWMSRTTLESSSPNYNDADHWDSYGKFFIYGDKEGEMTDEIRIYNKVGYAYGTLTDVAYIHDKANDISFFLTATILVNENEIFNDDTYEFDSLGIPFLATLGRLVLEDLRIQKISVLKAPRRLGVD